MSDPLTEPEPLTQREWFIQFFLGQGATQEEAEQYADENIATLEQAFLEVSNEGP